MTARFDGVPTGIVREQRRKAIAVLSLLLCVAIFLIHLPLLPNGNGANLARHALFHLFVVVWLALVFFRSRTVSARDVVAYWFVGFYAVFGVAILLTKPFKWWLGTNAIIDTFWIPLVEEAVKVAALLLLLRTAQHRADHQLAPSDLGLLGFAIGAGFSFHEDALWVRVTSDGFGDSFFRLLFPTITDRPGGFLSAGTYAVGHGVWGALAGLGLGLWWLFRRHRLAWLLAAVPFTLVALDHMRANARGWGERILDPLLFDGRLVPVLLLAGLLVTWLLELWIARWGDRHNQVFPRPALRPLLNRGLQVGSWKQRVDLWAAGLAYQRARNSFHFEMWRTAGAEHGRGDGSLFVTLSALGQRAGAVAAEMAAPPTPEPPETPAVTP